MSSHVSEPGPPGEMEFRSAVPDVITDYLQQAYGVGLHVHGLRDGHEFWHRRRDGGSFAVDDVRVPLRVRMRQDPFDNLVIVTLTAGRLGRECGGIVERFLPGDVLIDAEPGLPSSLDIADVHAHLVMLELPVLAQVADASPTRARGPIRFTGYQPVSPNAAAHWKTTSTYVAELLANVDAASKPLIRGNAARLLAAVALNTFPNTAIRESAAQDRNDATSATVRRAIAFIEQHAQSDVSLADIAASANVSIRAIQVAFRRHLNTTPMDYLRGVRLDWVHRELLDADPARGATVTDIATRWGFYNHSRFAARYRSAYGVMPRDTLRSG